MSNDNINQYADFISKQLNEGNGDSKEGNYVSFFDMVGPDEVNTLHGLMKKHGFKHGKDYKVHTAMGDTDPHGMTIHNNEIFKHPDIKAHVRDDMMGPGSEKGNRTDSKMKRAFNTEEVEQSEAHHVGDHVEIIAPGFASHGHKGIITKILPDGRHEVDLGGFKTGTQSRITTKSGLFGKPGETFQIPPKTMGGTKTIVEPSALRRIKEEVEQVDELKRETLSSYITKASKDAANKMSSAGVDYARSADNRNTDKNKSKELDKEAGKSYTKSMNRLSGIAMASKKLAKENVSFSEAELEAIENIIDNDQIDEKSMGPKAKPGQYDHIDPMRPKNTGTTRLIHPAPPKAKPGEEKHADPLPSKPKPGEGKHINPSSSKPKPGSMDKITPMKQPAFNTKHYNEESKMSNEKINLYAEFISNQLGSDSVNESNSAIARHAMSAKVKKYESEPVSKGEDHEIRFTGGDDNDMHYHGHVNGKKFTATSTYVGDNDDQDEETKRVKDDLSDGLKAHGISGDDHKKALKAIMKHARKEIHDTYHP